MTEACVSVSSRQHPETGVRLSDVQCWLSCTLCGGYLIDATTISRCLHTFCRACILSHLQAHCACPLCNRVINDFQPQLHLRRDTTLQRLVYKMVPGLYYNEKQRRREFEHSHGLSATTVNRRRRRHRRCHGLKRKLRNSMICCENDLLSVTLHYGLEGFSIQSAVDVIGKHERSELTMYLHCAAHVTVRVIKKLLCVKLDIGHEITVELFDQCGEHLADYYQLMDLFYIFHSEPVGTVQLRYVIVSALPIASSTSSASGHTSSGLVVTAGQVSTTAGQDYCDSKYSQQQSRRGRPSQPITRRPDVNVATCCSSGAIVTTKASCNVTVPTDKNTVPCAQQHRFTTSQQMRHSAVVAPVNSSVKHDGKGVVLDKQHSAVTCESARRYSADLQQRRSTKTHAENVSVTATNLTTTTHPATMTTTTNTSICCHDRDTVATVSMLIPGDCAMPLLWLPDQLPSSTHAATSSSNTNYDNYDVGDDEQGCRLMMPPMTSLHLIPLVAAPSPYPCIEPRYVDIAAVGMATFGVGLPAAGVGIATDDVVMTTVANVGMETAAGLMGHCLMSVDEDNVATSNDVMWPSLFHCVDSLYHPVSTSLHLPPTLPVSYDAQLLDGATGADEPSRESQVIDGPVSHPESRPAASASHLCGPSTANLLGRIVASPCLSLSDTADNVTTLTNVMSVTMSHQDINNDTIDITIADDVDTLQGGMISAASRPDVVSSNIPRSHFATTTNGLSSHSCSCSSSSCHVSSCSSVTDGHAAVTASVCSGSVTSSSSEGQVAVSMHHLDDHAYHMQQQQLLDDDVDNNDNDDDSTDELSQGAQLSSVDEQSNSVDQQPASSASAADSLDVEKPTN